MLAGNVITSLVGLFVGAMIASAPGILWPIRAPLVYLLCWLPSRRLATAASVRPLGLRSPAILAGIMSTAFLASCILFTVGRDALETHHRALYWIVKFVAIFLALLTSVALTTVWEEWVIWRLS